MQLGKVEIEDEMRNRWERGEGMWGGSENGESGAEWEQGIYLGLGQLLALSAVWCLHDGGMNITHLLPPPHLFSQPWRECVWVCGFWGGMATKVCPLTHLWRSGWDTKSNLSLAGHMVGFKTKSRSFQSVTGTKTETLAKTVNLAASSS